jgi:hypothetical protein
MSGVKHTPVSGVHPDLTALRAVDACGGTYTPAEEASGWADGHRAALASAMVAVGRADGITAGLLEALNRLLDQLSACGVVLECMAKPTPLIELLNTHAADAAVTAARAAISRATGPDTAGGGQ